MSWFPKLIARENVRTPTGAVMELSILEQLGDIYVVYNRSQRALVKHRKPRSTKDGVEYRWSIK